MHWCPDEIRAEILEHVELARRSLSHIPADSEESYGAALILAQGIRYLSMRIPMPGPLRAEVDALLSVPPSKPTGANFNRLFNALLKPTGYTAAWDKQESAWMITKKEGKRNDPVEPLRKVRSI
jgi:hypothetical protein